MFIYKVIKTLSRQTIMVSKILSGRRGVELTIDSMLSFCLFYASYFLNKIAALCPPKPKLVLMAAVTCISRFLFGT